MGHSQADKTESHDRIVKVAATRFREAGVDGVGVADLMKAAGLTHGGFYRHFASRDELVAEAIERALDDGGAAVSAIANRKHAALRALIDAYLSVAHRDGLATSCAVTKLVVGGTRKSRRVKAIAALSALVGAVSMARAVSDETLSREILESAADELKAALKSPR